MGRWGKLMDIETKGKTILMADDEVLIRKLVKDFLKREGFTLLEASDGKEAMDIFNKNIDKIDLVILDVMMPIYDGWSVCRQIRKTSKVPIIMLTAKSEEPDEILGFNLGADEYISKPFSPNILMARVKAILRRIPDSNEKVMELNNISIDSNAHVVTVDNVAVDLSPTEYDLLLYLVKNKGIALSREQILNGVWDYDYFGDSRAVDTNIKRLRAKLGEQGELIQTVRGLGYKLEVDNEKIQ
jgi:two-component system, OmpR family, response regulator ResD